MQVVMKGVGELKRAGYNPRVELKRGMPEYERLKRSVTEFELVQPLVWNEVTGHVVGGHQRLTVLEELGVEEVPVVVVSLPLEREKALNVALNNERVGGKWDVEKLQDLVSELAELPDFDETLTGFSEEDLRELLMEPVQEFLAEEEGGEDGKVRVTLGVEPEEWENFREGLDELVERYEVEVHVRMPG